MSEEVIFILVFFIAGAIGYSIKWIKDSTLKKGKWGILFQEKRDDCFFILARNIENNKLKFVKMYKWEIPNGWWPIDDYSFDRIRDIIEIP